MRRHPSGFSAIDTLLVIVLVILLGVLGWYVWHQRHQKKVSISATSAPIVAQKPAPPADPYAGWKTFTTHYSHLTIKYPSTWSFYRENGATGDSRSDSITIKSSNAFIVQLDDPVEGLGGVCQNCSTRFFNISNSLGKLAGQSVYIADTENIAEEKSTFSIDAQNFTDSQAQAGSLSLHGYRYATFALPANSDFPQGGAVLFQGQNRSKPLSTQTNFLHDPDYKNARLIMESLSF